MAVLDALHECLDLTLRPLEWMHGVEEGELKVEDGRQQVAQVVDQHCIVVEVPPAFPMRRREALCRLPRERERVQEQIRGDPREELHPRGAEDPRAVVVLEHVRHLGTVPDAPQLAHEHVPILHCLAASLAQVWHHWVARVAHQAHRAVRPRLEEGRRPVVERPVLDAGGGGRLHEVVDLLGPPHEAALHVVLLAVGRDGKLGALGNAAEGVPLDAALADVRAHEVPLGPHVDLVADVEVVLGLVHRLAGEHGVPAVGASGALALLRLAPHLRAGGRPDAVGPDEDVALQLGAVLQEDLDAGVVGEDGVACDLLRVLHRALRQRLQQHLLEVRPVHDARVGQREHVRGGLHGVEGAEPLGPQRVHEAVLPVPGEGEAVHEFVEQRLVDVPDDREGVRRELDGAAESGERRRLLKDLDLDRWNR
mmetsp:Transcript_107582/g.314561  ORF Transcript_107582/g.314561 Transcript_107582/m.314561 type:complete len:423 (-) Transcript_107582:423-1691(-)